MLDDHVDSVIDKVRPYVTNSIWLGKVNRLRGILRQNKVNNPKVYRKADKLIESQNDGAIKQLYDRYKDDEIIKWKESVKKVAALMLNQKAGMDA